MLMPFRSRITTTEGSLGLPFLLPATSLLEPAIAAGFGADQALKVERKPLITIDKNTAWQLDKVRLA